MSCWSIFTFLESAQMSCFPKVVHLKHCWGDTKTSYPTPPADWSMLPIPGNIVKSFGWWYWNPRKLEPQNVKLFASNDLCLVFANFWVKFFVNLGWCGDVVNPVTWLHHISPIWCSFHVLRITVSLGLKYLRVRWFSDAPPPTMQLGQSESSQLGDPQA